MSLSARVYFIGHPSRQAKASYAERERAIREHKSRSRLERLAGKLEQVPPPIAPAMSAGEAQRDAAHAMALLRRDHLLDDLSDREEDLIFQLAYGRAQGTVTPREWLLAVKSLGDRRRAGSWTTWDPPLGNDARNAGW